MGKVDFCTEMLLWFAFVRTTEILVAKFQMFSQRFFKFPLLESPMSKTIFVPEYRRAFTIQDGKLSGKHSCNNWPGHASKLARFITNRHSKLDFRCAIFTVLRTFRDSDQRRPLFQQYLFLSWCANVALCEREINFPVNSW